MNGLLALTLIAASTTACTTPRRPPPLTNQTAGTSYALQPLRLAGSEGMHSASHSSRTVRGQLELRGTAATLKLDETVAHPFVHCPASPDGQPHPRQACAEPDAKPFTTQRRRILRGTTQWSGGTLTADLRADGGARLALICEESFIGLACAVDDEDRRVFGFLGDRPEQLVFAAPGTRRYALQPTAPTGGALSGTVEVTADVVTVELTREGKPPVVLPGRLFWTTGGLQIDARTSATRTLALTGCQARGPDLACEITADRSVLGEPDHIYNAVTLVAER